MLLDDNHASHPPRICSRCKSSDASAALAEAEVVFAINANDIENGKRRSDIGVTYADDVLRLMDIFRARGLAIGGVVITQYSGQPKAKAYRARSKHGHCRVPPLPH